MIWRRWDLAQEIERLRRRYASVFEDTPDAVEAASVWEVAEETLCWHVVLRDALEPDIDVELLGDAIVVRAAPEERTGCLRQTILPVPSPFDASRSVVRFDAGVLEIRVFMAEEG